MNGVASLQTNHHLCKTMFKNNLFLILLFFCPLMLRAQFAIISDKDGYVNVRKEGKTGNNITDTLRNGHLVYRFEDEGNWCQIDYEKKGKQMYGYIYGDRCVQVSSYTHLPVMKEYKDSIVLKNDSITIIVSQKKFDKSKHNIRYYNGDNQPWIKLIDNEIYWGTDGEMPKTEYKSIKIKTGSRIITLPAKALKNLYEPSLYNTQAHYDEQSNIIYIQSMNSDGAGGYEVIWKIENGIYKERFVAYGF